MAISSVFSHWKWWFCVLMLNDQRVSFRLLTRWLLGLLRVTHTKKQPQWIWGSAHGEPATFDETRGHKKVPFIATEHQDFHHGLPFDPAEFLVMVIIQRNMCIAYYNTLNSRHDPLSWKWISLVIPLQIAVWVWITKIFPPESYA